MTRDDANALVLEILSGVAPEVDPATVDRAEELQVEFDLDSIDFLNVVEGVSNAIGRDIPERDYPSLATLDALVEYVVAATGGAVTPGP